MEAIIFGIVGGGLIAYGLTRRTITKSDVNELLENNVLSDEGKMCIVIGALFVLVAVMS